MEILIEIHTFSFQKMHLKTSSTNCRPFCLGLIVLTWLWRYPLQWHHNESDGASNHQPHDCLLSRLFRCRSKKTSKLCVTGLCAGNSPGTGEFHAQKSSDAENVSIWWRHHALCDKLAGLWILHAEITYPCRRRPTRSKRISCSYPLSRKKG